MKKACSLLVLSTLLTLAVAPRAGAEGNDVTFTFNAGADYNFGYTLYGIGWNFYDTAGYRYPIGFKVSELKFPANALRIYADAEMSIMDVVIISAHFDKNLTAAPGKMEDSDWGMWYLEGNAWADQSTLDVFSQSDAGLNAYTVELDFRYRFYPDASFTLGLGAGAVYQHYYSEVRDLDQWYPSYEQYSAYLDPAYAGHDYVAGLVGTYRVDYLIPLVELEAFLRVEETFRLKVLVGASPLVLAWDVDEHLLRSKTGTGTSNGIGVRCLLDARFNFTPFFHAGVNARFLFLHTWGKQSQFRYNDTPEGPAGPLGSVDTELESMQFSAGLSVGINF